MSKALEIGTEEGKNGHLQFSVSIEDFIECYNQYYRRDKESDYIQPCSEWYSYIQDFGKHKGAVHYEFTADKKIYEDRGQGFQEETSYFAGEMVTEEGEELHLVLPVEAGVRKIRIDPAFTDCMVRIRELKWNDRDLMWSGKASVLTANGTRLDDTGSFIFPTEDPNLIISLQGAVFEETNALELRMERSLIGREMALDVERAAKRRLRL